MKYREDINSSLDLLRLLSTGTSWWEYEKASGSTGLEFRKEVLSGERDVEVRNEDEASHKIWVEGWGLKSGILDNPISDEADRLETECSD